ncbi:MAG: tetratricopeptide repeat-containing sensor histidine kinase [Ignavibacterium sp.]|nr:tetratricopeptide repeat-containing sensor histidine kinase [Ignavibacterium sp.]
MKKHYILEILCILVFILSAIGNAQINIDSLKQIADKSEGKQKLKTLIKLGYFLSSEDPDNAVRYLDEAIVLADKINSRWSKADALFNKGVALWHLGEINQSDFFYEEAIKIYEEFNDSLSLIKVFNSQAINHKMKGNVDRAFEMFLRSLDYAKKIGDKPTIVNSLLNIGVLYDNNGDYQNCLKYYLEAIKYADQSNKASLALLQSYIADVYVVQKNFEMAELYLNQAIKNSKEVNDSKSLIWAYSSLGAIQVDKKNYSAAEKYFKESLSIARKTDFKLEIIHTLTDLGKFYIPINNLAEAEKYLVEALTLAKELNSLNDLNVIYREFSNLYAKNRNYKKAFEYLQQYKLYSDSLFAISNNEKITALQTRHDLKQKEKETNILITQNDLQKKIIYSQKVIALVIALLAIASIIFIWILLRNRNKILKSKNLLQIKNDEIENNREIISEKNKMLAGLNATKDKFFSIIAHDLRNPIAAFVNISELLELDYDKISDADKKEILAQMNSSSKNLLRLLENLLTWARLSNDQIDIYNEKVIVKDILESSIYPYLQSAQNKKIKITINAEPDIIIETDKFIFQNIIGNLINNAIKFSNLHSEITVSLSASNNSYAIVIKDNGIGIEESQLRNIFLLGKTSTGKGTMGESGTGLGLVLVKELVEKINWRIEVKSKVNTGSEFIINIPYKN